MPIPKFAIWIICCVGCAIAWSGLAPAETDPATAAKQPLAEYVKRAGGRYAYGLYVGAHKIGWSIDDMRLGELGGQPVAVITSEGHMEMLVMGNKAVFRWQQRTYHELTGDGSVLKVEETTQEDGSTTRIVAERKGTGLTVRTETAGRTTQRQTPLPKLTLKRIEQLDRWLTTVARAGDEFRSYSTALDAQDINRIEVYQYRGRRPFRWGGVATELIHVQLKTDGAAYEMDALPNGTAVKGKLGPFDMRLEEEAVARNLQAPVVDMTFEVPIDTRLGDPREVDSLTLEARDLGDVRIPQNATQRVSEGRDGAMVVAITRQPARVEPKPLTEAEKAVLLTATPSVQSDDPKIRKLAAEIVGDNKEPRAKAERINRWVHQHLRQTYQANASTALEVLANKAGDCTEHTLLFVALCRAAGVPARELGGLAYDESQVVGGAAHRPARRGGTFNWHAWAEIHDGRRWVSIDPTWNEVQVDATHLVLSVGPEDFAWVNILGKMKLRVIEFRKQG